MATASPKTVVVDHDEDSSSIVVVTPAEGSVKGTDEATSTDAAAKDGKATEKKDEDPASTAEAGATDDKDKGKDGEDEKEKIMVGMVGDFKNMYQKWDRHDRYTWTEQYPDDLEEAAENEETMKFALLVRNKKSYDSRKKTEIDSIVVQSPLMKKVLHDVLAKYPGVTTTLARLTFTAPFRPFVHRWDRLVAALSRDDLDEPTRAHVKVLHDVLAAELKDVLAAAKDYAANRAVSYEHVWTIFQPGSLVFASRYGQPVAVRLREGNFIEHPKVGPCFQLKCDRVDWDGNKFGLDTSTHIVMPFVGTVPIADLECFPLEFHSDAEGVRVALLERGRRFEHLAGYHYRAYKGPAIEQQQWGPAKITVDCRIVVDAYAHSKSNPNHQPQLKPLARAEMAGAAGTTADGKTQRVTEDDDGRGGYVTTAPAFDPYMNNGYDEYGNPVREDVDLAPAPGEERTMVPLTEEELLLCTPLVRGYALKLKKWLEFFVDHVGPVSFNEGAFDSLVLPDGHRSLVLALAQSQRLYRDAFDDVIQGKGKGIIMLLSGGPGIGKTLTAESVAEHMRVPLYTMSAGDLGSASWEVENNLNNVLEMVAKWGAVLLLDECDVFLQARSASDLDRNRIVSIFLRTLEYYEGILFLTTNRVKDMDPAFHSRIHVSLEYPSLDEAARGKVWRGFLDRTTVSVDGKVGASAGKKAHDLTDNQVDRLAKLEINGRQIKNVLKTANLLACNLGVRLAYEHLRTVLSVEGHKLEA